MLSQRARSRSRNFSSVVSSSPDSMAEPSSAASAPSDSASRVHAGAKMASEQPRSRASFTACKKTSALLIRHNDRIYYKVFCCENFHLSTTTYYNHAFIETLRVNYDVIFISQVCTEQHVFFACQL